MAGGNLAEQALSAALSYRAHAPILDSLLKEVGLAGGSLNDLTAGLVAAQASDSDQPAANDEAPSSPASAEVAVPLASSPPVESLTSAKFTPLI